jgi:alcohol dehydrogenase, propanol-preferring
MNEVKSTMPSVMNAMVLQSPGSPLVYMSVPLPTPLTGQVLVKVIACGVCRTDLHIIDGELDHPKLPLILGHEIVGIIVKTGDDVGSLKNGDLVGIPWLGFTCGKCKYCLSGRENLCDRALFTGYTLDGGFAEYTVANQQYCFKMPAGYGDAPASPLLCAGLIGFRSYSLLEGHVKHLGIYGFGAAAHILIQVAIFQGKKVYAFTRDGDEKTQSFAINLGASWSGGSSDSPPVKLDAAIIFAPVGSLVPKALRDLDKGGTVVCGGIHMSDIPAFPYKILWEERTLSSVANLTRKDGEEFFKLAPQVPVKTEIQEFRLIDANQAIEHLRKGLVQGAAVLTMN